MTFSFWSGFSSGDVDIWFRFLFSFVMQVSSNTNSDSKEQPRYLILSFSLIPMISLPSESRSTPCSNFPFRMIIMAWLFFAFRARPIFVNSDLIRSIVRHAEFTECDDKAWSSAKPDKQRRSYSSESSYPLLVANFESQISSYMKSMAMLKRIGDSGPPWGTPHFTSIGRDESLPRAITTLLFDSRLIIRSCKLTRRG